MQSFLDQIQSWKLVSFKVGGWHSTRTRWQRREDEGFWLSTVCSTAEQTDTSGQTGSRHYQIIASNLTVLGSVLISVQRPSFVAAVAVFLQGGGVCLFTVGYSEGWALCVNLERFGLHSV